MLRKTLTVVTVLCVIGVTVATTTPVFLWGTNSPSKPSFEKLSEKDFANDVAGKLLKNHMVVAFLEDNLSSNDFTCSSTDASGSCYAYLKEVSPKTYYANVEKPIDALLSVAAEHEYKSIDQSGKLKTPLKCATGKVVFVNLANGKEGERVNALETHDAAIAAITKEISCPVAYMYMSSKQTAHKRQRRALAETTDDGYFFRDDTKAQFILYFSKLYFISGNTTSGTSGTPTKTEIVIHEMTIKNGSVATENAPVTYFTVTLTAENGKTVEFNITSNSGYFSMGNVVYDGVKYRSSPYFSAPYTFSFSCGNLTLGAIPATTSETNANTLLWNSLQMQAPFGDFYNATFVFGDAWSCTGFFTTGVLMGLFVILLMLIILFTGICWMMDINTMDRFDDPKGKTITINAAE